MSFAVVMAAIVLFVWGRIPLELTSAALVTALLLLFHLHPLHDASGANILDARTLLAGFANPTLFAILALLVVGQGLFHTGAVEKLTRYLGGLLHLAPKYAISLTLLVAAGVSGLVNNTPVVIIFIPVLSAVATRLGQNAANVLMPLSFITILGGMTTLIGSSANLVAASVAEASGSPPIGFFDFAVPGLFLAAIGSIYVLLVVPRLLRPRVPQTAAGHSEAGKQFIAQITITKDHPWAGAKARAGYFPDLADMTVRLVQRGGRTYLPPFEDMTLQEGDTVIVAATRKVLLEALAQQKAEIGVSAARDEGSGASHPDERGSAEPREPLVLTEAVIAPGATIIGRTVKQAHLSDDASCRVVGIERRSRMVRTPMDQIHLEAGDVLLFLGTPKAIRSLRDNRDLLLLARSRAELPVPHHAQLALGIFAAMIITVVSGALPIAIAAMTAALAMILSGCLTVKQAARAFDRNIYLLVGTAFALAAALQKTGGAELLAHTVANVFSGYGPAALLSALFLLTAVMTNFLSNHATAALLAPIAVSAAIEIGADPAPFIFGLIFALNCSFATPIAYQTNLLVMGPGHYSFKDFAVAGTPLILILWLAYSLFAPFYYGL